MSTVRVSRWRRARPGHIGCIGLVIIVVLVVALYFATERTHAHLSFTEAIIAAGKALAAWGKWIADQAMKAFHLR